MKRTRIMIVGESGSGLLSVGEIVAKALKASGYFLTSDREFPSLIKGGQSKFTINYDDEPIYALSEQADVLVAMDKKSLKKYQYHLVDGGVLVHGYERIAGIQKELDAATERGCMVVHQMARETAYEFGGNELMSNMVMVGMLWKVLGLPYEAVAEEVKERFASKPKILAIDLLVLQAAFDRAVSIFKPPKPSGADTGIYLDGAQAIALGAVHAGVRLYVGYPMSPSTGILKHIANMADEYGIAFKQAEDEITAAQMSLGAMYAGTRSITATSGGGFDLMTETVSLSGITETPFVCVIAQRPGPGTGLPTWTAQGDLQLALRAGHGEFARIVLGASGAADSFTSIQHALNWAEQFQVPVLLLTDKCVQEQKTTVPPFAQREIEIKRGLVTGAELEKLQPSDRFQITESGISRRWVPTESAAYYYANGDEHDEKGNLTEDADPCQGMIAKRVRKLKTIAEALPEPQVLGQPSGADISFVGWGHTKGILQDIIREQAAAGVVVNYLHYDVLWPLKTEKLTEFLAKNDNVHLAETNATGQLGQLLAEAQKPVKNQFLKWNGRPFFVEDFEKYIAQNT